MTYPGHDEPAGDDMFFVADRMIKVESFESVAANTFALGSERRQPALMVTFKGDVNNSDGEKDAVTVGLSPADALSLIKAIRHSYQAFPLEDR